MPEQGTDRRVRAALGLLLVAATAGATGCGATPAPQSSGAVAPVSQSPAPDGVRLAGYCSDGTLSSDAAYAVRMRRLIADAVALWAATPTQETEAAGQPGRPRLRFVARSVTTTSNTTDGAAGIVEIDPVPPLPPRPSPGGSDYVDRIRAWTTQRTERVARAASAHQQASALAASMAAFPIVRHTTSGIYNCLGALADQLRPVGGGPGSRLVVASDMENNEPVVAMDLRGSAVMMITICPAGAAAACPGRFEAAHQMLRRHGASSVTQVRADAVRPLDVVTFWEETT
jgi:hypothetical protein